MDVSGKYRNTRRLLMLAALVCLLALLAPLALAQGDPAAVNSATLTLGKTTTPAGGQGFWITAAGYQTAWGRRGSANGQYRQPRDVEADSAGNFYVSDHRGSRITKLSSTGQFIAQIGGRGKGNGQILRPNQIAIFGNLLYVTDTDNHRITAFNTNGGFVTKWGGVGSGNGQFNYPNGVAVDASGNVYVADTWNHRIQVFDANGGYLRQWGTLGSANGQFRYPAHLDFGPDGLLYVADSNNHRIQVFDASGAFVRKFGVDGSGGGQFHLPVGVDAADDGYVYVADTYNNRVQKLTPTGAFVAGWSETGGATTLSRPNGLLARGNMVYVSDIDANKVQIYAQATAALNDGQQQALTLPAGTYNVLEAPKAGWTFGNATCNGGNPTPAGAGVRLTLADGASVTCGFTNNQ